MDEIDKIAQNIVSIEAGLLCFEKSAETDGGKKVFQKISTFIQQAHPKPSEIDKAIEMAKLKPTFTPCVILK